MPAYYRRTVAEFLQASPSEVIGDLTTGNARFGFCEVERDQIEAWEEEIVLLRGQLAELCKEQGHASQWGLLLEFPIPRRQRRIDAVLLAGKLVFVLEFKSGASGAAWSSGQQVEDYALDLAYFHAPSHHSVIIPAVIAPGLPYRSSFNVGSNVRSLATVPIEKLALFLAQHLKPREETIRYKSSCKIGMKARTSQCQPSSKQQWHFTLVCLFAK